MRSSKEIGFGGGLSQRGKSWRLRWMVDGCAKVAVLGSVDVLSVADARILALEARKQIAAGIDPSQQRKLCKANQAQTVTFSQCAEQFIHERGSRWTDKHREQWRSTLSMFAEPVFQNIPIEKIDRELVKRVLTPIWVNKNETASRVRGRIEQILDWAAFHNLRKGENPARWRGNLAFVLEKRSAIRSVTHFEALAVGDVPEFIARLRKQGGIASRAFEFLILTASRTSEVLGASWDEFDLESGIWNIPSKRMKARREHRVPLSERAVEILREMALVSSVGLVFPGGPSAVRRRVLGVPSSPLSNMAFLAVLRRMEVRVTAHGFRSSFRDWAAEKTSFPREVAEAALAHVVRDKTEAAYRRGDLFLKRRRMMDHWAKFCGQPRTHAATSVVAITRRSTVA